eukprot:4818290-Prymnesium_polylepis.1
MKAAELQAFAYELVQAPIDLEEGAASERSNALQVRARCPQHRPPRRPRTVSTPSPHRPRTVSAPSPHRPRT